MTEASLEQNLTAARDQHLVPGREIHMQDMRGYRFCEWVSLLAPARTTPSRTSGTRPVCAIRHLSNSTPRRGHDRRDNGAVRAWLNPVRHWMFDQIDVRETEATGYSGASPAPGWAR